MGCSNSSDKKKNKKNLKQLGAKKNNEIKVVFLGEAGVGKSSITNRYCNNEFSESYEVTIGGVILTNLYKNNTF